MTTALPAYLAAVNENTLTPLVQRALDAPSARVLSWECQPIYAGRGIGTAVYRFSGQAHHQGKTVPWSLILKVLNEDSVRADPAHPEWWRREAEAYRSGYLASLTVGLNSPRCFGVVDHPGEECWIWLEEVIDTMGGSWSLAHYGTVARHLGQFNGVYLEREPLPQWSWLSRNWLRQTVEQGGSALPRLRKSGDHPLIRRWLNHNRQEKLFALWAERDFFFSLLTHLPQTLCHMDAFRRNLFIGKNGDGSARLVAVDWSFTGHEVLGTEVICLTAGTLVFMEVDIEKAQELDEIVFDSYIQGLCDVGWCGDPRQIRLAYRTASLRYALGLVGPILHALTHEESYSHRQRIFNRSIEECADCWGELCQWFFTHLDEARHLARILS
jgi:hypothetical protein